ncbi:unnamed protein product [Fraxinus pennsylvanica]|uniref:Apple domain-containing protein n=1 Tax=Fraxinus pennsylvanica TaxID=56036 RepID=A0AAD2E1C2_9LAMI|nr:unnamed protein product [Fraxinus pennsylvanica]
MVENTKEWILIVSLPGQQCKVYAYCGAFSTCNQYSSPFYFCLPGFVQNLEKDRNTKDYSGGCVRKNNLWCENGPDGKDKFLANSQVMLPSNSQSVMVKSARECEYTCLNSCCCTAYSSDCHECLVWNGELMNLKKLSDNDSNGRTIYIRLSASAVQLLSTK